MTPLLALALAAAASGAVATPPADKVPAPPAEDVAARPAAVLPAPAGVADTGAAAPDTGARGSWRASLSYGFEDFTSSWASWQAWDARFERKTASGSIAAEALASTRFGVWDQGGALDAYHLLWRRAYGNLRIGLAPGAQVTPRFDLTAEVYQGLPAAWEASASYRRMSYATSGVNLWGASLAKYAGNWYVVARLTAVPQAGRLGGGISLLARRYLETADDYVDLSAGTGNEIVTLAADSVAVDRSRFLAARLQRFLTARVGVSVAATYNTQQGIPTRRGLTVAAMYRW